MTLSSDEARSATNVGVEPGSREWKSSVDFLPKFNEAEESIRVLIRKHLPHGSKQELARLTNQHPNHISSQLSGESGLREKTLSAAIWILLQHPQLHAVATAVKLMRDGEAQIELRETPGLVIEFGSGQLCLPGLK
jgi:hypothetical protein